MHHPYMVRFTILSLLLVLSTKPLLRSLATAFSTAAISFSNPLANAASSFISGYRSGHYKRNLHTTAGEVELNVPKLKGVPFETAIIERYRRRESSVEEALIEMYLAGVSVRRVEDITEALWGTKVSPGTISNLNKKAYEHIENWRSRPLSGEYPYVYVDGVYLKRNWGGEIQNVSVLVAIGVNEDGCCEIIGAAEGMKEDKAERAEAFRCGEETTGGYRRTPYLHGLSDPALDEDPDQQYHRTPES